jgi:phage terminase large subunit-like protein
MAVESSSAKRKVVKTGRRWGKTTLAAQISIKKFLVGHRILYAVPTQEQVDRFWTECKLALDEPIRAGWLYKNETRHLIELPGTEQRIRAKTAWDANTLRGDYADFLILDEFQLMKKDAWDKVGAPMLLDNDGDAMFIYTTDRGTFYAKELLAKAKADETGRWAYWERPSTDNPALSKVALEEMVQDMSSLSYRMEILGEDLGDNEDALWDREILDMSRAQHHPELDRIVIGVDPPGSVSGECGIVVAGASYQPQPMHGYILADYSIRGTPATWGQAVLDAYEEFQADRVVGETNFGGDMVEYTIRSMNPNISYQGVRASRGKVVRAEPVLALYERDRLHHVGTLQELEDEMCSWVPGEKGMPSPNRVDALVWAASELMLGHKNYGPPGIRRYA